MRVDFHCHSWYSPDSISSIEKLLKAAHAHGLDRLIVTDHNTIRGALAAFKLEPEFVIVGEEIQTSYGEFLVSFIKEELPKGIDPFKAIELLHAQNAFISVSHPFDPLRSGWPIGLLREIAPLVDALETNNARVPDDQMNIDAQEFAAECHLPGTAGSDAHTLYEVGRLALDLPPFSDVEELRRVIGQGKVVGKISPYWVHGLSMASKTLKKLKLVPSP